MNMIKNSYFRVTQATQYDRMKKALFLFLALFLSLGLNAQDFLEVQALAQRRVPWLVPHLVLRADSTLASGDAFHLEQDGKRIIITATSTSAASKGLGHYLRTYCARSMSHLGDNLSRPAKHHSIDTPVTITSTHRYRYALNYCTVSYSMAHYTWEDWERELDWMALSGVNLLLAPVGMEAVWMQTLKHLGYSHEEARAFIAHPVFSAWWLMGNLEGWGGPASDELITNQLNLQRQILARMKSLGIEPVLQGFYGIVPTTLSSKLGAKVTPQGRWAGGFLRPDFLAPTDPAFARVAEAYYDAMKTLYGEGYRFFGGDPFHEGGATGGLDIAQVAHAIQQAMMQAYPGSTWALQGWGDNPSPSLLSGLDKKHALVIELFGENTRNWERRRGYEGTPFVWCNVSNFGEKNGLYGKLQRFSDEVAVASQSPYKHLLAGVGIIPEGIHNNPITYDWTLEQSWLPAGSSIESWLETYLRGRYGKVEVEALEAWRLLLRSVYSSPKVRQEGPSESLFCARPAHDIRSVSTWGTHERHYDPQLVEQAAKLFLVAETKYKGSETFHTDKLDLLRQVLSNRGKSLYHEMMQALKAKDATTFEALSKRFLKLIKLQDELMSLSPFFRLDYWLGHYKRFARGDKDEARQAIRNAKMQYTIWGSEENPKTDLHEYAHKEWSGLLGSLYYDRWARFIDREVRLLRGETVKPIDYFALELAWVNDPAIPATPRITSARYRQILRELTLLP